VKEIRELKRRKQLRGLVAEIADSLVEAAELLEEEHNGMRSAGKQTHAGTGSATGVTVMWDQTDDKKEEEKGS
jgi:hypothetical protein